MEPVETALTLYQAGGLFLVIAAVTVGICWKVASKVAERKIEVMTQKEISGFQQKLDVMTELSKSDYQKSLQNYSLYISKMHNSYAKIFELAHEAFSKAIWAFGPCVKEIPDLTVTSLHYGDFEPFFREQGFTQSHLEYLENNWDLNRTHAISKAYEILSSCERNAARFALKELQNTYIVNRIYISADIDLILTEIVRLLTRWHNRIRFPGSAVRDSDELDIIHEELKKNLCNLKDLMRSELQL